MKFLQALVAGVAGLQVVAVVASPIVPETSNVVERGIVSNILDDIKDAATCTACEV